MKRTSTLPVALAALALLLTLSFPAHATKSASRVVELTPKNFADYISTPQVKYVFVLYCATWSRNCAPVRKAWDGLSMSQSTGRNWDVFIAAYVDGHKYSELAKRMNITGFPTMIYYTPDEPEGIEYAGGREVTLLDSFVFQFT